MANRDRDTSTLLRRGFSVIGGRENVVLIVQFPFPHTSSHAPRGP